MIKVLFVCLGNICRSPAAEGVFKKLVADHNLSDKISIDSAGTSAHHKGEMADSRMRKHAGLRGYDLTSKSRPLYFPKDYDNFDYIIVMDNSNLDNVNALDRESEYRRKIFKMTDFAKKRKETEVPDPYYGGEAGFEQVLDIVEDGCQGLLEEIQSKLY